MTPPDDAVLALFRRAEGCTVKQYGEAVGITRQAASVRLRRFAEQGILVVTDVPTALRVEDLSSRALRVVSGQHVYRLA